MKGQHRPK